MSQPPISRHDRRLAMQATYRRRRLMVGGISLGVLILIVVLIVSMGSGGSSKNAASSTTTKQAVTTTTAATNDVTMAFVGDTMMGNTPNLPPNAATYFSGVASALNVPTVFMNLEGTITDSASSGKCGASTGNCYAFRNPISYAQLYRNAGFTVMNSANNHSHDFGSTTDTTQALQAAGIAQTGLPGQIAYVTQGKTKIAMIGFAPYSNANNLLDLTNAANLIKQAKTQAQVVVVYMHVGAEGGSATHVTGGEEVYVGEDRGNPKAFAHAAVDAGANLVVASGPHVLRGMEWYNGVLINYSLANFAGYNNFSTSYPMSLTGVLSVTLKSNGSYISGHFTPVVMNSVGQPSIGGGSIGFVNDLSKADFGFSGVYIQPNGAILAPTPPTTTTTAKKK